MQIIGGTSTEHLNTVLKQSIRSTKILYGERIKVNQCHLPPHAGAQLANLMVCVAASLNVSISNVMF